MASELGLVGDWLRSMWPRIDAAAGRNVDATLTARPTDDGWHAALHGAGFEIRVDADTAEECGDRIVAEIEGDTPR